MDKFKLKLTEAILFNSEIVLTDAQLNIYVKLFLDIKVYKWSGDREHIALKSLSGRRLRLAKAFYFKVQDVENHSLHLSTFKIFMRKEIEG